MASTRSSVRAVRWLGALGSVALLLALASGCAKRIAYPSGAIYRDHDGARLVVDNQSPQVVCYVHIRPDWQARWGPDQLETAEILRPGARRSWYLPPGRYALRLQDCNRRLLWEGDDLDVKPEGGTFTLRGADDGSL